MRSVKLIRLTRGLRQREVSRKTGIIQNYLSQIENGIRVPQGENSPSSRSSTVSRLTRC